jgi:hypothetical protein
MSQAVVPGATVRLVNVGTGVAKEAMTNESGIYFFGDLQPGSYKVTVTAKSFGTVTSDRLDIESNRVRRFDATLMIARITESVIVTAGAEALQTDRADSTLMSRHGKSRTSPWAAPWAGTIRAS